MAGAGFLFLILAAQVSAAPVYGTDMPDEDRWIAGYQEDVLFGRELEQDFGKIKSRSHFINISYGPKDWFSFDFKIGVGDIVNRPDNSSKVAYNPHFAGGYGFRLRLFDNDESRIKGVFGFQHISVHPADRNVDTDKHEAILDDWQLSMVFSKAFDSFTPYIGAAVSRIDYIHKLNGRRNRLMSESPYAGIAIGADVRLGERLKINLEGRFIDETAVSAGISRRF